jgi:hypothetical protein
MKKYLFLLIVTTALNIVQLVDAFAQSRFQISSSNLYCEVDYVGPYIVLIPTNAAQSVFTVAYATSLVRGKISGYSKSIKSIKALIKEGINKTKNKKKLSKLTADKVFWEKVAQEILVCGLLPPLSLPTPAPTIAPTPTVGGSVVIPISNYYLIDGAEIYANDGQFLGVFSSNQFSSNSIANKFGSCGSDFSSTSIFNDFGNYGSNFSSKSPWNQFASAPPILYIGNDAVAYLTTNQLRTPRVDPYNLLDWLGRTR